VKSPAELFDLTGRVAVVTGASRGLGREMVLGFARAGADVVVASRKLESCEAVAREVESATGRKALAYACHVGRWPELEPFVDAVYSRFGKIDVFVNNAGMSPLYDHVVNVTEELYEKVLAVNLKGPFRLTALVGTRMAAGDGGSIINVSSVGAVHPGADIVPYSAAKAGLNAMTVAFAYAFGPKVRVNCIMPGAFMTHATKDWDRDAFGKAAARFALQRGADPAEIVGTALYLASDASSYTTGAILRVDGGVP
jgi:NAD(P)-dependent dehydrogenase (short-subunit alcohol dehydrogenase family)